jgi:NADP-dependent 3-hydroxy acid dehydrogenase YdfG
MVIAITGASSGIGRALAVELAKRGARLALAARRFDRLQELEKELGSGHLIMKTDVAIEQECLNFVARTREHFGRLDTLVCNAGSAVLRGIAETTSDEWQRLMAVNLGGTTACIQAAVPLMRAQEMRDGWRGQIVLVSSCLARRSVPDMGAYAATKAAQLSVAEALRIEELPNRIAVTSVHPIGTSTEFDAVSEQNSGRRISARSKHEMVQEPTVVAHAMITAIVQPRAEVWPHRLSRWFFGVATLLPGLVDKAMVRFRRRMT